MEEICIVIVQKLIYQVDRNRPSKLKKFYFDDHLKWHTLKFLVLIWSGIFEACLSVGLKIFDLSCEVFSPWKIKSKKWGKNCTQKLGKNMSQASGLSAILTIKSTNQIYWCILCLEMFTDQRYFLWLETILKVR